jgi:hypothetical protein
LTPARQTGKQKQVLTGLLTRGYPERRTKEAQVDQANKLLSAAEQRLASNSQTPCERTTNFSDYEKQATVYFFDRLSAIYLKKFTSQFSGADNLSKVRHEWAKDIGKLSREQIDKGMDVAKQEYKRGNRDYCWPNIGLIVGLCKSGYGRDAKAHRIYRPERLLVDQASKDKAQKAGRKAFQEIREQWA